MALGEYLTEILSASYTDGVFESLQSKAMTIAFGVATFAFGVSVAFNYAKKQVSLFSANKVEEIQVLDYELMVRSIVIVLMIGIYPSISSFLASSVNSINSASTPDYIQQEEFNANIMKIYSNASSSSKKTMLEFAKKHKGESASDLQKLYPGMKDDYAEKMASAINSADVSEYIADEDKWWSDYIIDAINYMSHPSIWLTDFFRSLSTLFVSIIRIVATFVSVYGFKFLLAIGPLAMAFSLFPVFKNQMSTWISSTINIGLLMTTINFLDHLFYEVSNKIDLEYYDNYKYINAQATYDLNQIMGNSGYSINMMISIISINVSFISLYLVSFWLTSKFVGTGDGGKIMGKAAMITAAAAMAVYETGKSGVSAVSGGGGSKSSGGSSSGGSKIDGSSLRDD